MKLTSIQKTALIILSCFWTLGGIRLFGTGSFMLLQSTNINKVLILCILLALSIGFLKGRFLLSKTAERVLNNLQTLDSSQRINYFIGWLKILAPRGIIMISLMISLSIIAGNFLDPFGRGLLRITIGTALLVGSVYLIKGFKTKS